MLLVLAPYVRYSYYENKVVRLFLDGGIGISSVKYGDNSEGGFELGIKPGLAIKLNNHFSLVAKCGFLGYRDDYAYGTVVTDFHSVVKTFHLVSITSSDKEPLYNIKERGILEYSGFPFPLYKI